MADTIIVNPPAVEPVEKHVPHILNIRMWPKTPVLYPMAIMALIAGFITLWSEQGSHTHHVVAIVFLGVSAFSLFTLTVDVSFTWALAWALGVVIVALILFIANIYTTFLEDVLPFLASFRPEMNAHVYFSFFFIWVALMLVGLIIVRFHYVRIESNEVIVVGGVLDKRRRFSTMGVRYTKEITDVFEYYLPFVRAGRLVLRFPGEEEPVVLENVLHMDRVIAHLEHITSSMQITGEVVETR